MAIDAYHYVYRHFCPQTGATRYVGKGCGGRAWHHIGRSLRHMEWIADRYEEGLIPTDFVEILHKNLTDTQAVEVEQKEMLQRLDEHPEGLLNNTPIRCPETGDITKDHIQTVPWSPNPKKWKDIVKQRVMKKLDLELDLDETFSKKNCQWKKN